jgi:hypothetical protein
VLNGTVPGPASNSIAGSVRQRLGKEGPTIGPSGKWHRAGTRLRSARRAEGARLTDFRSAAVYEERGRSPRTVNADGYCKREYGAILNSQGRWICRPCRQIGPRESPCPFLAAGPGANDVRLIQSRQRLLDRILGVVPRVPTITDEETIGKLAAGSRQTRHFATAR